MLRVYRRSGSAAINLQGESRPETVEVLKKMVAILPNIVLVFLASALVLTLCGKIRVPAIVGLLITGMGIGPYGLRLIEDRAQIEMLSEIGIILLMFSIGLDFNRDRIAELRRTVRSGLFQIVFCIAVTFAIAVFGFQQDWEFSLLLGFLVSHTSSTLILKIFSDRGEVATAPSRLGLGISITQDLASVPMMFVLPLMAATGSIEPANFSSAILQSSAILIVAAVIAKWVLPRWLDMVIQSRSRELLLFFLMLTCLGASWATQAAGLSVALGAFIAGLVLAGSHYSHQIHAEVASLRDLLISLFFISIGMLLDVASLPQHINQVVPLLLAVFVVKYLSGFIPILMAGYPLRTATLTGVTVAQIGEFSFVLAHSGFALGLLSADVYQTFIVTSVLTMIASPFLIGGGSKFAEVVDLLPWPAAIREGRFAQRDAVQLEELHDHVVIAGYGLNGHNLVRSLHALNVAHAALEMSPDVVARAQQDGEAVYFGDCTRPEVLKRMQIDQARVFVVAISDAEATRRAVQVARLQNQGIHIIVRTRYLYEIEPLLKLGADEVIPEEFETSLEILTRTLHTYQIPSSKVDATIVNFRLNAYRALREIAPLPQDTSLLEELTPALQIEAIRVEAGSVACAKTLKESALPTRTGATVLAVRRKGQLQTIPPADFKVLALDTLIIAGTNRQISATRELLSPPSG